MALVRVNSLVVLLSDHSPAVGWVEQRKSGARGRRQRACCTNNHTSSPLALKRREPQDATGGTDEVALCNILKSIDDTVNKGSVSRKPLIGSVDERRIQLTVNCTLPPQELEVDNVVRDDDAPFL